MGAVSQALVDFAKYVRQPAAPGIEVIETPRYRIVLQPDFPIPGPNSVGWVRCRPDEADVLIDEVRARVAPRHVPPTWHLHPAPARADWRWRARRESKAAWQSGAARCQPRSWPGWVSKR